MKVTIRTKSDQPTPPITFDQDIVAIQQANRIGTFKLEGTTLFVNIDALGYLVATPTAADLKRESE